MDPMIWVWFALLASITICFCVYFVLFFRDRRDHQETIRQALSQEQPVDAESLGMLAHGFGDPAAELRRALSSVGSGIGFVAAGLVFHFGGFGQNVVVPVLALSAIVLGHGAGRLGAALLNRRKGE